MIDWTTIYAELKSEGWSLGKLERELDIAKSTMQNSKNGVDIGSRSGIKIIIFWAKQTGKTLNQIPGC